MVVYKIRRESDGKYSNGEKQLSFTTEGMRWPAKQHLTSYLMTLPSKVMQQYAGCVIVAVEVTETEVEDSVSVQQHVDAERKLIAERHREAKRRQATVEKEKRFEEYKKLKAEFE